MGKKPKKKAETKLFTAQCSVTLNGAILTVTAASEEEARQKILKNEWDDIVYAHAEMVDWDVLSHTIKEGDQ